MQAKRKGRAAIVRRIGYDDLEKGWLAGTHLLSTRERIDSAFRRGLESEDRYIATPTIFAGDQIEATAGFFVAFTRAKQRVVFTYCRRRGERTKIATLYNLLSNAGVKSIKVA
ncbi:hypothetical protein [Mesorhizobium delmotii]|uniref:Uncharacterized protein n=1 Tax=Mesorhizobium delmotii TaxID=1631247 RepID=A0A2P9AWK2_9HYPH|nr:hypothetical protein [Mesorhizobium delmotii]SJM35589.1 hypothetical protein BQ8482_800012 [Mesorhizobium delmotii]